MLPYLFTQRDVHSTTVKESLKPRLELGTQTHDALRPACRTSSGVRAPPHITNHRRPNLRMNDQVLRVFNGFYKQIYSQPKLF